MEAGPEPPGGHLFVYFYLKAKLERQTDKWQTTDRNLHLLVQWPEVDWSKARSREFLPSLPCHCQNPGNLTLLHCFPRLLPGSWIGTGAHVWYQYQRWQLYLPHHSTDSVAIHFFFLIWWVNMWPKWVNTLGITLDTYFLSLGLVIRQVKMTSSFGPTGVFTTTMSYEQHSLYLYNRMLDSLPLPIPAMSGYTLT